jgi:hypothetical protein
MSKIWESSLTEEMVKGMSPDEIDLLIADLDDAVMAIIEDYNLDGE